MDALTAFSDSLVRKTDDREFGIARCNLALHFNTARLQPQIGNGLNSRDHYLLTICAQQFETIRCAMLPRVMIVIQAPRNTTFYAYIGRVTDLSVSAIIESARLSILILPILLSLRLV